MKTTIIRHVISIITMVFLPNSFNILSAQEDLSKTKFRIPENEFLVDRLVRQLEEEVKILNIQSKEYESVLNFVSRTKQDFEKIDFKSIDIENEDSLSKLRREVINTLENNRIDSDDIGDFELKSILAQQRRILIQMIEALGLDEDIDANEISNLQNSVNNFFSKSSSKIQGMKQVNQSEIEKKENHLEELYNHKGQNTDLHRVAILMGLPAFCVTILLLFLVPYYLERNKEEGNTTEQSNKQSLLDVATVLLLTMTILILGLAKMITGEVLGTLLGGISGYVLNRTMKN
ncbi:MAG: hypothetical protein ACFB0A_01760 [Croceivirga sp.]